MTPPPLFQAQQQPQPIGYVDFHFPGAWMLFSVDIVLTVNGAHVANFSIKDPFHIQIPVYQEVNYFHAEAKFLIITRRADICVEVPQGQMVRLFLDYDRIWGSIGFYRPR